MPKTLAESIKEMEGDLEGCQRTNEYLTAWKFCYEKASAATKTEMIKDLMRKCNFTEEEIKMSLK